MADNSLRTPGTGETIATDDIGGVKYPRTKLAIGADGAADDVQPAADSQTTATVLPAGALAWNRAGANWVLASSGSRDGETVANLLATMPEFYNGATGDRVRGNIEGTLLASAARTASTNSANQTNYNSRGALLFLNVTSAGTGTAQITVTGVDPISGGGYQIAVGVAGGGATSLLVYPGVLDADYTADAKSVVLPRTWFASVVKSDGSSWTYSLGYSLIL